MPPAAALPMVILLALPSSPLCAAAAADDRSAIVLGLMMPPCRLLFPPPLPLLPIFIRRAWPAVKARVALPGGEHDRGGLLCRLPACWCSPDPLRRRCRETPLVDDASEPAYEAETRWWTLRRLSPPAPPAPPTPAAPTPETRFAPELAVPPMLDSRSRLLAR